MIFNFGLHDVWDTLFILFGNVFFHSHYMSILVQSFLSTVFIMVSSFYSFPHLIILESANFRKFYTSFKIIHSHCMLNYFLPPLKMLSSLKSNQIFLQHTLFL